MFIATGQGMLGNNMFAYCGNSPVNCADPSGTVTMECLGNGADMISMPWKDVGSGGSRLRVRYHTAYDQISGLIMNQCDFAYSKRPFGLGTYESNGCAAIATYNVMQLLGKPQSLGSISDEYLNEHGTLLYGVLGIDPWRFNNYFAKHGVSSAGYWTFSSLDSNISEGDVVIFTIINDTQNILKGLHTIAAQYINGEYIVYNAYKNCGYGVSVDNLNNIYDHSQWLYGYIVGG